MLTVGCTHRVTSYCFFKLPFYLKLDICQILFFSLFDQNNLSKLEFNLITF
jgi:hypothetical protein